METEPAHDWAEGIAPVAVVEEGKMPEEFGLADEVETVGEPAVVVGGRSAQELVDKYSDLAEKGSIGLPVVEAGTTF